MLAFLLALPKAEELHSCLSPESQRASASSFPALQGEQLFALSSSLISRTTCFPRCQLGALEEPSPTVHKAGTAG